MALADIDEGSSEFTPRQSVQEQQIKISDHDDARFYVRAEPLWLLLTEAVVDLQVRVGQHFSVGPILSYMHNGSGIYYKGHVADRFVYEDTTQRTGYGVKGAWYLRGVNRNSLYVSLSFQHIDAKVKATEDDFWLFADGEDFNLKNEQSSQFSENVSILGVGYQWATNSRLRMNVGGGISVYDSPDSIKIVADNGRQYNYSFEDVSNTNLHIASKLRLPITLFLFGELYSDRLDI